jgi:tRNA threonylcarbamoyladenosine biosynthesis protein TsaB
MLGLDTIGPRNLLVIDTSTERAAVGVFVAPDSVNWTSSEADRKHGRDLVPCVRDLLETAGLAIHDLHVVAVGIGPGSFTGLRIGLTAAKTLAYATSADLVGFDSLEGLAANAPADALSVHVVADAQRGDVYAADFARQAPGEPLRRVCESRIEPLAGWSSRLGGTGVVLGPGLASPSILAAISEGTEIVADPDCHRPRADRLIELARRLWQSGRRDDLHALEPRYLRRSAAEERWAAPARSSSPTKP